jgi:Tol biopolymer transport system component
MGSRIAVSIAGDDRQSDIWIIDSVRGTRIRLTSQGGTSPAWSADGREIIFTTSGFSNETYGALARMPSDGSGAPKLVVETPGASSQQLRAIGSWGGTTMVFARLAGVRGRLHSDLFHVVEGKDPVAILATPADERTPGVSPDGKWCAYVSNASGRDEISVWGTRPLSETCRATHSATALRLPTTTWQRTAVSSRSNEEPPSQTSVSR